MRNRLVAIVMLCVLMLSVAVPVLADVTYSDGRSSNYREYKEDGGTLGKRQFRLMDKLMELFRKLHEDVLNLANKASEEADELIEKTLDKVDYWVKRIKK